MENPFVVRRPWILAFGVRLAELEAVLWTVCAVVVILVGWGIGDLGIAVVVGGVVLGVFAILPLFLGTPTNSIVFLNGMQGFQAFDVLSEWGERPPPGGANADRRQDMARANHAIPRSLLLIATALVAVVLGCIVILL
jgi:hypothetical protein